MLQDIHVTDMIAGVAFLLVIIGYLAAVSHRLRKLRKEASQLRRDMAEMEAAYANAPLGLAMFNTDLRYIKINKLLAAINGLSVQDHIGKSLHDVVPDLAAQAEEPFSRVIRTGEPVLGIVFEGTTGAQPGVRRFWRENVYPIFAGDGKVVGINVAVEEITEEKRLNDALRASELRERQRATELEAVMNAAPAAILLSRDVSCSHLTGNAECNRLLRLKPGENASANLTDGQSMRPFTESANGCPLRPDQLPMQVAAATGKEVRGAELSFHFKNGDVLHALANAAPLLSQAGEVVGAVGAFIDVTAQKLAEQALLRENQRKDEFLAMLAHELRNPLASIRTGLDLMKLDRAASPSLRHTRDIMERQLSHLVRLIDDLLDVSRISFGKLELKKEKLAVRTIIDNVMEVSRLHVEASGHKLDVKLPAAPLHVEADLVRMSQVISNLLNNAAKYTPQGGCITLAAERDDADAVIRVIDNGIGIDSEMLPKVFDMFSQVENGRNRRKGGIGIGLSLARQLVEMHGGTLTAESAGSGRGSVFTVRLPLCDASRDDNPKRARQSDTPASSGNRRVLIVDDNIDAAQMLGALLELSGHIVQLAYTGQDAVNTAREFHPEIAFLDIGLPDMSGLEVARALRKDESLQRSTLVALTGWGNQKDRIESKEAGFDFHLTKPVTIDAIKNIMPDLEMSSGY